MPVSLTRLRIAGFKSFADAVSIDILPGLTGIVGPNGCGKSNVVEALRWAMGESSARSLRGGEMDDVIFAGSGSRPSRNLAEVTLSLDETRGLAPPPFHDAPELQVSRKIERGVGSVFRVNGREARARDVQTLFADMATGARASAMVSQGRVAAIVGAAPAERRLLLEEAAGITGLHARRHEAELKLRAAELNLTRAEDARVQLEGQLDGLRRQAKQAARHRALADAVRATEAELLAIQHASAVAGREAARARLAAATVAVTATAAAAAAASTRAAEAQAALPSLREAEGEARAVVERARAARAAVAADVARATEARAAADRRLSQATADLTHARVRAAEDARTAERHEADAARLAAERQDHPQRIARAAARLGSAEAGLAAAESAALRAGEAAAETLARNRAATEARRAAAARAERATAALTRAEADFARASAAVVAPERRAEAARTLDRATAERDAVRARHTEAERAQATTAAALRDARTAMNAADAGRARTAAALRGLSDALGPEAAEAGRAIDLLRVPPGLEAAVGAALGDDLEAGLDPTAARHWLVLPPIEAAADTLAAMVDPPPALQRALAMVRLADACDPAALRPGERVASRAGDVWRWDGHVTRAGAPSPATVRLRQRRQLRELRADLATAEAAAGTAARAQTAAEHAERAAVADAARARDGLRAAETACERTAAAAAALEREAGAADARLAAVTGQTDPARAEADAADAALTEAEAALAAAPDATAAQAEAAAARAAVDATRREEAAARQARDALAREAAGHEHRARALARDRAELAGRSGDGAGRITDLAARVTEAEAARRALADPAATAGREAEAIETLEVAEATLRRAGDARHTAESEAAAADRAGRAADAAAALAREQAARAEGDTAQADHAWGAVAERVIERLGSAGALPTVGDTGTDAEERARRKLDRLTRERDGMGPVNHRAELEADAAAEQVATIAREGEELAHAIARLRGSIGHLNREGRQKLSDTFAAIDAHFQSLFGRMFQGGRAHLALVGSDDPLQAGLEIYAQPPGKKLSALSLLSGGEQALTALSLIFAVFRCNPAPVCVLDEVDAPLDDANVERLCGLLSDIVAETRTRFLVVTHHPHTMGRMDRLFGVTMQERGVSRLLSVDLARATALADVAIAAE